ncbi:MAG: hypothetical protein IKV47_07275 [Oscillospiraceae bacterium]|nr:hypothetical protein [Oscillospiraceae bacterium]
MAELTWSKSPLPGDILKIWPKDEKGEPVKPACLTHCVSNDFQDVMLVNMLMSYEIPAFLMHPGDGDFGKVVLGMSGTGSNIYVPETMLEDAKNLMEAEPDDEFYE